MAKMATGGLAKPTLVLPHKALKGNPEKKVKPAPKVIKETPAQLALRATRAKRATLAPLDKTALLHILEPTATGGSARLIPV